MPTSWVSSPSRSALGGFVTGAVMASSRSSSPPGPLLEITRRWRGRSTTWRRQSRSFAERGVIFEEYDVPGLKTVNGIAEVEGNYPSKGGVGEMAAWFKDSEGNLLAIGRAVT